MPRTVYLSRTSGGRFMARHRDAPTLVLFNDDVERLRFVMLGVLGPDTVFAWEEEVQHLACPPRLRAGPPER